MIAEIVALIPDDKITTTETPITTINVIIGINILRKSKLIYI
jgi:hypothetical protein